MHLVNTLSFLAILPFGFAFPNPRATDPFDELLLNLTSVGLKTSDSNYTTIEGQIRTLKDSANRNGFSKCQSAVS